MFLLKNLSVTITGVAFVALGIKNLAFSSSTLAQQIIPKSQLSTQSNPSAGVSLCKASASASSSSSSSSSSHSSASSSSSGNFCKTETNLTATDTIAVNVDWNAVQAENTALELDFGLNLPAGFKLEDLNNFLVGLRATTTTSDENAVVAFAVKNSDTRRKNLLLINRSNSPKQIKTNFNGWTAAQTTIDKYKISSLGYTSEIISWNSVSNGNLVLPENSMTLLSFTD